MAQPRHSRPIQYARSDDEAGHPVAKRIAIALLVLIILCLGGAWALGWFKSTDRAVTDVVQLQNKLADPNLKDTERRALWREMREKMDGLPADAREQTWEAGRQRFEQRMNQHIKEVLSMSRADQIKALDADIDRIERFEKMRQEREAAQSSNQQNGARQFPNQ